MIYMRGNTKDYDNWAAIGNSEWSFKDCLPYFKKLEDMTQRTIFNGKNSLLNHKVPKLKWCLKKSYQPAKQSFHVNSALFRFLRCRYYASSYIL